MGRVKADRFSELIEVALKAGATAAGIIPANRVVVDDRVRLKCEVPRCAGYGRFLTCPPHVMSVDLFRKTLSGYKWSLLVQVVAEGIDSTDKARGRINQTILKMYRNLHRPFKLRLFRIVDAVESAAFKRGMRFAAGFGGGSCILCEQCVKDKSSQPCRHPFRARPPMEAVGIDVVKTAQNAGLPIHLSSSKNVAWTGLVLLE